LRRSRPRAQARARQTAPGNLSDNFVILFLHFDEFDAAAPQYEAKTPKFAELF
jgi:hypothetical protein